MLKQATIRKEDRVMSSIIYRTDPATGAVYAYRSTSYRDPNTKRPRSKQEYLGRYDAATDTILPKGTNGKRNRSSATKQLLDVENKVAAIERELNDSKERIGYLESRVKISEHFVDAVKEAIRQQEEALISISSSADATEGGAGS